MNDTVNTKAIDSKDKMVEIKCAKCHGDLMFDNKNRYFKCTECGNIVPDWPDLNYSTDDYELHVYPISNECPNCKAKLRYSLNYDRFYCNHCNSIFLLNNCSGEKVCDMICPFYLTSRKALIKRFGEIVTAEHVSEKMQRKVKISEIKSCYLPLYAFEVECDARYTIEVAHEYETREWDSTTQKFRNVTKTDWQLDSGTLDCSETFTFQGFRNSDIVLQNSLLQQSSVTKQLTQFISLLSIQHPGGSNYRSYSPVFTFDKEIIQSLDPEDAWKAYGESIFDNKVESKISSLYSSKTRYLHWNGTKEFPGHIKVLNPVWVIEYTYNENSYVIFLDGYDGQRYRGTVPISLNRALGKFFKWVLPLVTLVGGFSLTRYLLNNFNIGTLGSVAIMIGIAILTISISSRIFKEFRKKNY